MIRCQFEQTGTQSRSRVERAATVITAYEVPANAPPSPLASAIFIARSTTCVGVSARSALANSASERKSR
jgi:hypothetical protein